MRRKPEKKVLPPNQTWSIGKLYNTLPQHELNILKQVDRKIFCKSKIQKLRIEMDRVSKKRGNLYWINSKSIWKRRQNLLRKENEMQGA